MALSIVIGITLFAGLVALLAASYQDRTRDSQAPSAPDHEHRTGPDGDECLLCHAPLPHLGTPDDAVREIERRIATDLSDVAGGLGAGLARLER